MYTLDVRNVNDALPMALHILEKVGVERDSRNGPVVKFPEPVTTKYRSPCERVLFYKERDANPFFHLFESLWMLAGRNDVAWLKQFNSNIAQYSDDNETYHGAYGYRWQKHFTGEANLVEGNEENGVWECLPINQLDAIIDILKHNKDDRRCVLQMWDARVDLNRIGKDFPCNLMCVFSVNDNGALDMMVYNRSNDIVWGAYGANAVHFSILQEYMAAAVGVPVGIYWQVSNNLHAYKDTLEKVKDLAALGEEILNMPTVTNPYDLVKPYPLVSTDIKQWDFDLQVFMEKGIVQNFNDPFFKQVVTPLWWAWKAFKQKEDPRRFQNALNNVTQCKAEDWKIACREWLERRLEVANARGTY